MSEFTPSLFGLVPAVLKPKTRRILLENFELPLDIGFHDFEIGNPQRLVVTIEVWLDEASFADSDQADRAWNYDFLRSGVVKLVEGRRFNLQETLAREIRSEEHTFELQSLMRLPYPVFCLKKNRLVWTQ